MVSGHLLSPVSTCWRVLVLDDETVFKVAYVACVYHWRLSSYSAELWAIIEAFAECSCPLTIHADSLTVVKQFEAAH